MTPAPAAAERSTPIEISANPGSANTVPQQSRNENNAVKNIVQRIKVALRVARDDVNLSLARSETVVRSLVFGSH
jgi:hypothetical protein